MLGCLYSNHRQAHVDSGPISEKVKRKICHMASPGFAPDWPGTSDAARDISDIGYITRSTAVTDHSTAAAVRATTPSRHCL